MTGAELIEAIQICGGETEQVWVDVLDSLESKLIIQGIHPDHLSDIQRSWLEKHSFTWHSGEWSTYL